MTIARRFLTVALLGPGLGCAGARTRPAMTGDAGPDLGRGIATAVSLISASIGTLIPGAVFLIAKDGRVVHE